MKIEKDNKRILRISQLNHSKLLYILQLKTECLRGLIVTFLKVLYCLTNIKTYYGNFYGNFGKREKLHNCPNVKDEFLNYLLNQFLKACPNIRG